MGSPEYAKIEAARERRDQLAAERKQQEVIKNRLAALWRLRGRRYSRCTLGNFRAATDAQRSARANVRHYIQRLPEMIQAGTGLLLYGPPGTGKDHLLAAVMRAAVEQGDTVTWCSGPELFARLRDRMDTGEAEGGWIRLLTEPRTLAISDPVSPLGSLSKYEAGMLYAVIDQRYSKCKPTWVTLNAKGHADASAKLTEAILDRLKHDAVVVPCDWESFRKPLPKRK